MAEGYGLVQVMSGNTLYDFGTVTSITDTLTKSITSIPIVSLPTDCTFALESNTANKFVVNFTRKNPIKLVEGVATTYESDADYYSTSWKWTNALWNTAITSLLNRWQLRTDGYLLFINVANVDRSGGDASEYSPVNTSFPMYAGINVYIASIEINIEGGSPEYLSGSAEFVIGGRLTEKLSRNAEDPIKFKLTPSSNFDEDFIAYAQKDISNRYVPLRNAVEANTYNTHNEYTEGIAVSDSYIALTAFEMSEGAISAETEVPLLIGKKYERGVEAQYDWQYDYYNTLDLIASYTITGGVENPFEKITASFSKRAFSRTYPDIGMDLTTGEEVGDGSSIKARIIPGLSKLSVKAVGRGEFIITECALNNNNYVLTGYCSAEQIKGLYINTNGQTWSTPFDALYDLLTNSSWGLNPVYEPYQIISNVSNAGEDWRSFVPSEYASQDWDSAKNSMKNNDDTRARTGEYVDATIWKLMDMGGRGTFLVSVAPSAPVWPVMQACAYMLNAKMFFANNRVYIIDYTKLAEVGDESVNAIPQNPSVDIEGTNRSANRLIVRAGLDRAIFPANHWGLAVDSQNNPIPWDELTPETKAKINELDSMELHSYNTLDRLAGRTYGIVTQDSQGLTTVYNTACVTYNVFVKYSSTDDNRQTVRTKTIKRTLWFGMQKNSQGEEIITEWISGLDNPDAYSPTNNQEDEYVMVRKLATKSIQNCGEHRYTLDLSQYFTYTPEEFARRVLYTILNYRVEPQESVKFTVNERCTGALTDDGVGGRGETYWSALFPLVCAAKQFTDIEQEMKVSAISTFYPTEFFPQKLALSKYSREYPSGRTTYWFGVTNSLDLATSTSEIRTLIRK